jgi:hypothetical protein
MATSSFPKTIRTGLWWTVGVGAVIALIAGQGAITRVAIVVLAVAGAGGLGLAAWEHHWLKTKARAVVVPLVICAGMFSLAVLLWPHEEHITPENAEEQAVKWLADRNIPAVRSTVPPNFSAFALEATAPNGQKILITRPKKDEVSLIFIVTLYTPPEQVEALTHKSPKEHDAVVYKIKAEATKQGMSHVFDRRFEKIMLAQEVLMTKLNADNLFEEVVHASMAAAIVRDIIASEAGTPVEH